MIGGFYPGGGYPGGSLLEQATAADEETGAGVAGLVGSGVLDAVLNRTGGGVAGTVGAGALASEYVDAGAGVAGTAASGFAMAGALFEQTGSGIVGTVGSGRRAVESERTGTGIVGTDGHGRNTSPPKLVRAIAFQNKVQVIFNKPVAGGDPADFTVTFNGATSTVSATAATGRAVTLTHAHTVTSKTDTVAVTYTA